MATTWTRWLRCSGLPSARFISISLLMFAHPFIHSQTGTPSGHLRQTNWRSRMRTELKDSNGRTVELEPTRQHGTQSLVAVKTGSESCVANRVVSRSVRHQYGAVYALVSRAHWFKSTYFIFEHLQTARKWLVNDSSDDNGHLHIHVVRNVAGWLLRRFVSPEPRRLTTSILDNE